MFSDDLFQNLPEDPILAAHKLCQVFCTFDRTLPEQEKLTHSDQYLNAMGAFQAFADSYALNIDFPELVGDRHQNTQEISDFFQALYGALDTEVAKMTVENARSHYSSKFSATYYYQFTEENLKKLSMLVESLYYQIESNQELSDEARFRLVRKLDATKGKIQRKMTNLDILWGLIGEARVTLGNNNNGVKQIHDRINAIANITRITQARLIKSGSSGEKASITPIIQGKNQKIS